MSARASKVYLGGDGEEVSIPFQGTVDIQWRLKSGVQVQREIHFVDSVAKGSWEQEESFEQIEFDPECKYLTEQLR